MSIEEGPEFVTGGSLEMSITSVRSLRRLPVVVLLKEDFCEGASGCAGE